MSILTTRHSLAFSVFSCAAACCAPIATSTGLEIVGSNADHPTVPGGDISDVRMTVELAIVGGLATFTFTNTSILPETSAVIDEIVLDLYDDDEATDGAVLWGAVILTLPSDPEHVGFTMGDSNGLPGYGPMPSETPALLEFGANPPPTQWGLEIGESLVVQFNTALPDGPDRIDDYLAWFDGGSDTADYSIGFHAISTSTLDGESLTGIYVPEPATISLGVLGLLVVLRLRKTRSR